MATPGVRASLRGNLPSSTAAQIDASPYCSSGQGDRQTPIYWDSTCRWTYILPPPVCGCDRLEVILVWNDSSVQLMIWLYTPNLGMGFWFHKQYDQRPIACDQLNDVIPLLFDHYNDCDCSEAICTVTAL